MGQKKKMAPKAKAPKSSGPKVRNPEIAKGVYKLARGVAFGKKGRWTKGLKKVAKKAGEKAVKPPKFYAPDDVKTPLVNRRKAKAPKLRKSISPGSVLILLAGRFRGKRVVFLKQLESGLLLVTGPYKVNGVPPRRVPQSYVIATKTTVDVSKVAVPASVTDALFKKAKTAKKKDEELFFEKDKESVIDDSRKAIQKQVDDKLVAEISKTPLLKAYLSSKFSLKKGQKPHAMTF